MNCFWANISLVVVVFTTIWVVSAVSAGCKSSEKVESKDKKWQCKGEVGCFIDIRKVAGQCREEADDEDDKGARSLRKNICIWEEEGVVSGNKFSEDGFKNFMKKLFPENGQALGDFVYTACVTEIPSNVENLYKDDDPRSFESLIICTFRQIREFCQQY